MTSSNNDPSVMDQILDRAIEQNPHASELLKAFGPVILRQRKLVEAGSPAVLDYSIVDAEKLKSGIPVIRQTGLFHENEDFKGITLALAEAVKEALPNLSEGLDHFCDLIQKGRIDPSDYFRSSPEDEKNAAEIWGKDFKVSPSNASFLMSLVSRVILERRAREVTAVLGALEWEKGYCPICGDFPSIALIEEEGGKRFLHCSSCGHDWRFTRVVCPYCENQAQQGMDYFYIENKTQETAFICEKCRKYLVTLYRAGRLLERDMDISAISLVHLDMIMQDRGYQPMTTCLWNVLGP